MAASAGGRARRTELKATLLDAYGIALAAIARDVRPQNVHLLTGPIIAINSEKKMVETLPEEAPAALLAELVTRGIAHVKDTHGAMVGARLMLSGQRCVTAIETAITDLETAGGDP